MAQKRAPSLAFAFKGRWRIEAVAGRLVAYDFGSGRVTDLAGPGAGGRTVRQAFVLTTPP